jgi:hypothetical protein
MDFTILISILVAGWSKRPLLKVTAHDFYILSKGVLPASGFYKCFIDDQKKGTFSRILFLSPGDRK